MDRKQVLEAMGVKVYDWAIPQEWSDRVRKEVGDPYGHFVWCYDHNSIYGYPVATDGEGAYILDRMLRLMSEVVRYG